MKATDDSFLNEASFAAAQPVDAPLPVERQISTSGILEKEVDGGTVKSEHQLSNYNNSHEDPTKAVNKSLQP